LARPGLVPGRDVIREERQFDRRRDVGMAAEHELEPRRPATRRTDHEYDGDVGQRHRARIVGGAFRGLYRWLVVGRLWTRKARVPTVDIAASALDANPYPVYRYLRESAPVAVAPSLGGRYLVARWDDVEAILKDDSLYSARIPDPPNLPANLSGSVFFVDG